MLRTLILVCLCLFAALAPRAAAQDDATLAVGSAAPPLVIEQWPRGVPVTRFERGRVYVVEFWATWCTPCHLVVPKLTELQRNNPALTVIGVAASEQASSPHRDDRLEKVQDYIFKRSDEIGYTMAYDGSGETWRRWMVAAQRGGIPAAFIIGPDGRLAWIGNPLVPDFEKELAATLARPEVNRTPAPTRFTGVTAPRSAQLPPRKLSVPPAAQAAPPRAAAPLPQASATPRPAPREIRIEFVPEAGKSTVSGRPATQLALPELQPPAKSAAGTPPKASSTPQAARPAARPAAAAPTPKPAAKKPAAKKPAPKPAPKNAAKPATRPTKDPAPRAPTKPAGKPASKPESKPANKPASKPAGNR